MKTKLFILIAVLYGMVAFGQDTETHSNGPLDTGDTAADGTVAPEGYTWSEVQHPEGSNKGYDTRSNGYGLADDFIIPEGETWKILSVDLFGVQPGMEEYPYSSVNLKFYDGAPNGTGTVVYEEDDINVTESGSDAMMYRILNSAANTNDHIWMVNAELGEELELSEGTYWMFFNIDPVDYDGGSYSPFVTILGETGIPGANALQLFFGEWYTVIDSFTYAQQEFPFIITYTVEGLGVPEVREMDSRIVAYPNPTMDSFKLLLPDDVKTEASSVELFDMNGKLLKTYGIADSYNISELSNGVYLIKIKTNEVYKTLRIVKK